VKGVSAGKLDVNVPVHSDNEIGQLAVAINSMIRRLEISLTRERDLEEIRKELF
jgi:HAMP domain-containing protein